MINKVDERYKKFKSIFIKQYIDKYKKVLKSDISEIIDTFYVDLNSYDDKDIDIIHKKNLKNVYFLKRRWYERYETNKKNIQEKDGIKFEYDQVLTGARRIEQFKNYYNVDNYESYIEKKEKILINWRNSVDNRLSDFPYIHHLDVRLIKTALKYDLLIEYYKFIKDIKYESSGSIKRIPIFLDTLAIDPTNKKKLIIEGDDRDINGKYVEVFSYISQEEKELLLVQLEKDAYIKMQQGKNVQDIVTQMALLKATDTMNNYDSKILSYIYTCFYNDILAETITKQVSEILNEINIENNTSNKKKVINSILKLSKLNLEYKINEVHLSGSLFDAYIEKDKKTKENKITIQLGAFFKSIIYMNEGYNFDKKVYDELNSDSQHYALWFQKRRIKLCGEGIMQEYIHINIVLGAILWNTSRYDRRLKRVLMSLEELKNSKLIIEDYKYNKKTYEVEIKYLELPLRIQERIKNHDFKTSEIVEGGVELIR